MRSLRRREAQERLQTLYARTPGPVVFVDESFRPPVVVDFSIVTVQTVIRTGDDGMMKAKDEGITTYLE